jgi:pyruvate kinase
LNGVKLGERKNMNLPGAVVALPTLTEKDEEDLVEFGIKQGVDFVAASFVRKASDVEYIRDVLGPKGAYIKIISKIENQEGLHNYDEILAASDGIMVARGDLGMEIPPEKVFIAQKWMIEKANIAGKPVIASTQTLDSMVRAPRPTRSEAIDLANCMLDGVDCIQLGDEVSKGDYPVNAVTCLSRIAVETEKTLNHKKIYNDILMYTPPPVSNAEAMA